MSGSQRSGSTWPRRISGNPASDEWLPTLPSPASAGRHRRRHRNQLDARTPGRVGVVDALYAPIVAADAVGGARSATRGLLCLQTRRRRPSRGCGGDLQKVRRVGSLSLLGDERQRHRRAARTADWSAAITLPSSRRETLIEVPAARGPGDELVVRPEMDGGSRRRTGMAPKPGRGLP